MTVDANWQGYLSGSDQFKQRRFDGGSILVLDILTRASLHGKCVLAERRTALVNSANFTEAAQSSNIEVGVLITNESIVRRIAEYFETLCQKKLKLCMLPNERGRCLC